MSARRLKFSWQSQYLTGQGQRLVITTSDGYLIADEVFKFYRQNIDPTDLSAGTVDNFISVCTPEELTTLPAGSPSDSSGYYFRKAVIDKTYPTASGADEALLAVKGDVQVLKEALDAADSLTTPSYEWIGTPP